MHQIEQVVQWFADNRVILKSRLAAYEDDLDRGLTMLDAMKHVPWWDVMARVYRWRLKQALAFIGSEARDIRTRIEIYQRMEESIDRDQVYQAALFESIVQEQRVGRGRAFRTLFSLTGETILRHSREVTIGGELSELRAALLTERNVTV